MNTSWLNRTLNRLKSRGPIRWCLDRMPIGLKSRIRSMIDWWTGPSRLQQLLQQQGRTNVLLSHSIYATAKNSARFQEPKRLLKHGFKIYSQHDEDGILEEIFRRIGETNRFFVEFGVGDGLENCTLYLLLKGWQGAWIDGSAQCYTLIKEKFRFLMESDRLRALYSFINAENIEALFRQLQVPESPDLLSIDIDYNDFWVWRAIANYRPRVVAIEYNASFGPTADCVVEYKPNSIWDYTNCFGASLAALERLGREKGYSLVGCNYTGVTAFFVRDDLIADVFAAPFTAANHHEPPLYFIAMPNGHPEGFGPLVLTDRSS